MFYHYYMFHRLNCVIFIYMDSLSQLSEVSLRSCPLILYCGVSNRVQQSNVYCIVIFQIFHQTASYLGKDTFFNLMFLLLSHRPLPEQVMIKCSLNEGINMSMELLNYTVGPVNYQIYQFLKAISSQTKTYGYSEEINKLTFLQSHIL